MRRLSLPTDSRDPRGPPDPRHSYPVAAASGSPVESRAPAGAGGPGGAWLPRQRLEADYHLAQQMQQVCLKLA